MKTTISFIAFLFASIAFAGGSVGNGGDGVVCRSIDGTIQSVELLDYYEARVQRGFHLNLGDPSESYQLKIDRILQKLSRLAMIRSKKYAELGNSFLKEATFISGVDLVDVPDSQNILVAKSCKIEQLAIQRKPELPGDKLYTISKDLWDKLDENSKAGLILHEIIYREALEWKHENSVAVRYLNGLIASLEFEKMDQKSFNELMVSLNFPGIDLWGTLVDSEVRSNDVVYGSLETDFFDSVLPPTFEYKQLTLSSKEFLLFFDKASNSLKSAYKVVGIHRANWNVQLAADKWLVLEFGDGEKIKEIDTALAGETVINRGPSQITLMSGTTLYLDENENPFAYWGGIRSTNSSTGYDSGLLQSDAAKSSDVRTIAPSGVILQGSFEGTRVLPTPQGPLEFTCTTGGYVIETIRFSDNTMVQEGHLVPGQKVKTQNGEEVSRENQKITFTPEGLAKLSY